MKLKKFFLIAIIIALGLLSGCGTHYCSYGGCMKKVENSGDRCSEHAGKKNDPNYGLPDKWRATGDWIYD